MTNSAQENKLIRLRLSIDDPGKLGHQEQRGFTQLVTFSPLEVTLQAAFIVFLLFSIRL